MWISKTQETKGRHTYHIVPSLLSFHFPTPSAIRFEPKKEKISNHVFGDYRKETRVCVSHPIVHCLFPAFRLTYRVFPFPLYYLVRFSFFMVLRFASFHRPSPRIPPDWPLIVTSSHLDRRLFPSIRPLHCYITQSRAFQHQSHIKRIC